MKNSWKLALCGRTPFAPTLIVFALVAACGGEDPASSSSSSSSSGGGSGSTSTSSGGAGSSSTSSGGAGGEGASTSSGGAGGSSSSSGEVCHPSKDDPLVQNCAPDAKCTCNETPYLPEAPCPSQIGNVCSPGHNQCGCDLPLGEDYILPDPECMTYIDGDTWGDKDGKHGDAISETDDNGQQEAHFSHLGSGAPYFTGFKIQGEKIIWNQANRDQYESAEGEFSGDCKQITMRYYKPLKGDGELPPSSTAIITFLHHGLE